MNQNISVVINTYNAQKHLAQVLETVKLFDEIVVCDMESTDATEKIAQGYGCKIVTFPKGDCKSAEPARTFAVQSASSDWVLVVFHPQGARGTSSAPCGTYHRASK